MRKSVSVIQSIVSRLNPIVLTILGLPWLILAANKNWTFNPPYSIDPWVYLGCFLRLDQYLQAFPETYYVTRLSWILTGNFAYSFLPPLVANYVLHLGFYYIAVASLYLILRFLIGTRAALFTAVLMGCYSYFLFAIGWDYVDGAGITYYLVTILLLTCATCLKHWKLFVLLAGISTGATLFTNTAWIILTPALILYYWLLNRRQRQNSVYISILFFLAGLLIITGVLGTINTTLGGQFLFFLPAMAFIKSTAGKPNQWTQDWQLWLPTATWLLLPVVAFISSVLLLLKFHRRRLCDSKILHLPLANVASIGFSTCYLISLLILIILQIRGTPVLQLQYYVSYLIPWAFLVIGSLLNPILNQLKYHQYLTLTIGFVGLTLLFLRTSTDTSHPIPYLVLPVFSLALAAYPLCIYKLKGSEIRTEGFRVVILAALILSHSFSLVNFEVFAPPPANFQTIQSRENIFLATVKTQKLLKIIDPEVKFLFWYDQNETPVYHAIAAANMWAYRLIGQDFPDLRTPSDYPDKPLNFEQLKVFFRTSSEIAILSNRPDAFERAQNSLKSIGRTAKIKARYDISERNIRFALTIVEVSQKLSAGI